MKSIKNYFYIRLVILKASIVYSFQQETAYWLNNWGNLVSTSIFIITQVLFINIIFYNVTEIAGYNKNEILFFTLVGQFWFYIFVGILLKNLDRFNRNVNTGYLDLILIKPVPSLFYVNFNTMPLLGLLRDALPPTLILASVINWSGLTISLGSLLAGLFIVVLGIICTNCIELIATLPAFWIGESSSLGAVALDFEYSAGHQFPLEGWEEPLKTIFITILPVGLSSGLGSSVMLAKTSPFPAVFIAIFATGLFLFLRSFLWHKALNHYSSASS